MSLFFFGISNKDVYSFKKKKKKKLPHAKGHKADQRDRKRIEKNKETTNYKEKD